MRLHLAFYAAWPGPALAPALPWPGPIPAAVLGLLPDLADVPKLQSNFHFSAHVFRLNSHFGHNFAVFTFALALNCNFWRAHAPVHCLPSLSNSLSPLFLSPSWPCFMPCCCCCCCLCFSALQLRLRSLCA